jgi:hypothetical protein
MKRTVVKIKSNPQTDEIFCEINGQVLELMGAYSALAESLIQSFSKEENGTAMLRMLRKDTIEMFDAAGIFEKDWDKND